MKKTALKYGLYLGLANVMWLLAEYFGGLHDKHHELFFIITPFSMLLPVIFMLLAYLHLKKQQELTNLYLRRMIPGAIITAIATAVSVLGQFIYHTAINPDYFQNMIELSRAKGFQGAEQYFTLSSYLMQVFMTQLLLGLVLTLLLPVFIKNKH